MKNFKVCVTKTEYYYTIVEAESCSEAEDKVIEDGLELVVLDFNYDDSQVEVFSVWETEE